MRQSANGGGPQIRIATTGDLPALLGLLSQLRRPGPEMPEPPGGSDVVSVWAAILADERRTLLVAEVDDEIVGTADMIVVPNLTHGARPVAFIENVVVEEERRGAGVGRALMVECEARALDAGCYKIQLLSALHRTAAHRFYESLGYEATSRGYRRYFDLSADTS